MSSLNKQEEEAKRTVEVQDDIVGDPDAGADARGSAEIDIQELHDAQDRQQKELEKLRKANDQQAKVESDTARIEEGFKQGAQPGSQVAKVCVTGSTNDTIPGARQEQRASQRMSQLDDRISIASCEFDTLNMEPSVPGAHGALGGSQRGKVRRSNIPLTSTGDNAVSTATDNTVRDRIGSELTRPGVQSIRRGSQLGKGNSQRGRSTSTAQPVVGAIGMPGGRVSQTGSKLNKGLSNNSMGSSLSIIDHNESTQSVAGAIGDRVSSQAGSKLSKGLSGNSMGSLSVNDHTARPQSMSEKTRSSSRGLKQGKFNSKNSLSEQAEDITETEEMTDSSDVRGVPGSLNLSLWNRRGQEGEAYRNNILDSIQAMPEPSPEPTAASSPGAFNAAPWGAVQRVENFISSLRGVTTEEEINVPPEDEAEIDVYPANSSGFVAARASSTVPPLIRGTQGVSNLAVATEVQEDSPPLELPRAASFHGMDGKRAETKRRMKVYAAIGILVLVVIVGIVVGVILTSENEVASGEPEAVEYMETLVSKPSVKGLFNGLPMKTKESILKGDTPQARAWEWLVGHKDILKLQEFRKQQLFALSTFFYAFEGPLWPKRLSQNWLDDTMSECSWITTDLEYLNEISEKFMRTTMYDMTPCNEDGQVQTLAMRFLALEGANPFLPPEIALLPSLTSIVLPFNEIEVPLSDLMPPELSQLPHLEVFILPFNKIQGTIPADMHMIMTSLQYLVLGTSQLSGAIPSQIAKMSRLRQLTIHDNPLVGSLPTELGLMTKLTDIEIFNNLVSGTLPTELGLLTDLNEMAFPDNEITGTIPSQLGLFTGMRRHLLLAGNNLSGTLPSELGQLTQTTNLDLANNELLEGRIPSELGLLAGAKLLKLDKNKLSGVLPSQLGLLSKMEHLRLDDNYLSGSMPSQVWGLPMLKQVYLSNLPLLSGAVPEALCLLNKNTSCIAELEMATTKKCSVSFDCTESMCGCDCPCANSTV